MNEKEIDAIVTLRLMLRAIQGLAEQGMEAFDEAFADQKKAPVKRKGRPVGSKNKPKGKKK